MKETKFEYLFINKINKKYIKKHFTIEELECFEFDIFMLENTSLELLARRQYTGLKDKNGVEIYNGDILSRCFDDYDEPCIVSYEHGILSAKPISVEFYRPLNIFDCKTSCHWIPVDSKNYDFQIIGNIYENPELLHVKE